MSKYDSSHLPKRKNKIKPKPPYNGGQGGQGGPDGEMGDTWTGYLPGQGPSAPCWTYARDWPEARPGVHFFDMTCGDGPARLREKRGGAGVSRSCLNNNTLCDDCSAVGCDNSCIVYSTGNEEYYPWWGASSSSSTGQAHCGCSPHCGCANEEEYCGGPIINYCYWGFCSPNNGDPDYYQIFYDCSSSGGLGECSNCGT